MYEQQPINVTPSYIDYDSGKPKRRVNKVLYVLIALLLGDLGIHKFYIGQNFKGFLYLIFSWTCIPAILAAVSAIYVMFFVHADTDGMVYL